MLIRVLGCTVYATSTVLGAFMAGLALGSYLLGRYADRARRLLRVYALLELGIGLTALAVPFVFNSLVPVYRWIYSSTSQMALSVGRASLVFICLVVPASLMGGTLPVLSGLLARKESQFGCRVGSLYGVNTLGAVLGVVGAGFVFIGELGELNTILIGVGGNVCAAAVAFYLDWRMAPVAAAFTVDGQPETRELVLDRGISPYSAGVRRVIVAVFAVSGFVALAYEVVWMRVLQLFLRTSIYAFSVMLAIYLTGVALGSLWGRRFVDRLKDPAYLFAAVEILIAILCVVGMALLVPMDSAPLEFFLGLSAALLAAVVVVFPATLCLGILFPTVSRCFTKSEGSVGQAIGKLYSLNTVGCILGSLVCGFLLIPVLGTWKTVLTLAGINVLLGLVLFLTDLRRLRWVLTSAVIVGGLGVTFIGWAVVKDPFLQIIRNRVQRDLGDDGIIYLHRENVAATITAFGSKTRPLYKRLWLNGVGMTVLVTDTKLMAHLPILLCEHPKDVLVVCFGMGTTVRSAVAHEDVAVDAVELVPDTYSAFGFYHADGPEILKNPRVHHYVDDGRSFLLMRDRKYDVITIDPAPPIYSAGTVNLYAREFICLCRDRLNSGGVLCL
jgi:spermidine synthase